MRKLLSPLLSLLYPKLCIGCDREEPVYQDMYCAYCWKDLPRFIRDEGTKRLINTRFPIIGSSEFFALYLFTKSGIVQNVLHKIKYKGRKDIAHNLGNLIAEQINAARYDAIVPIPMHKSKKLKRGFNQAEEFARGISDGLGIPVSEKLLKKTINTTSQTQMDRVSRRINIEKAYSITTSLSKSLNRILLVDDVVTSGATLEVCTDIIHRDQPNVSIDYAFIALSV